MNRGFIEPTLKETDWVLAGVFPVLNEDGQWGFYLPPVEFQRRYGVETSACVTFTMLTCVQILYKRMYGIDADFAERYNAVCAGTTRQGVDPQNVAQSIRKNGVVAQYLLPFDENITSFDNFHSPNPMEDFLLEIGAEWLDHNVFTHDWVITPSMKLDKKQNIIMKALQNSPLMVSVDAWHKSGDLYVKTKGARDNHATTLYGYVEGEYWLIFDTYDNTKKKLAWDYDFGWVKRFRIEKKTAENEQQALIERIVDMLITLWQKIRNVVGF